MTLDVSVRIKDVMSFSPVKEVRDVEIGTERKTEKGVRVGEKGG